LQRNGEIAAPLQVFRGKSAADEDCHGGK
jgi:hypothetical protein